MPETLEFNSAEQRPAQMDKRSACLMGYPFLLNEHIQLIDWGGWVILENRQGYIPSDLPLMLERL